MLSVQFGMPWFSPFPSGDCLFAPLHQWMASPLPRYQHSRSLSQHSHMLPPHPHKTISHAEHERGTPGSSSLRFSTSLPLVGSHRLMLYLEALLASLSDIAILSYLLVSIRQEPHRAVSTGSFSITKPSS